MATYCNAFKMETDENKFGFAQNPDSFASWQGLRGPYYTPVVSADGTLSWVNNGGLPNPQPVNIAGPPGPGLEIQDVVETVQQLPTGAAQGDVWLVGTDSPYEAYIWVSGGWLGLGQVAVGPQGPEGEPGTDGVSPEVTVTEISGGHRVTITDAGGTQTFDVMDGEDGAPGSPGAPGVSPDVAVTEITGGHRVTITDAGGTQTFDVMDGEDGQPGSPGAAGVSPDVAVTTITGGHRVTITDAGGTQTFDVMDGQPGSPGAAGPGVASGGAAGQVLAKASATDYDTEWIDPPDPSGYVSYAEAQTLTDAQQAQARENIGANWDLLWQNASPTSQFAAQTISVDYSAYARIMVFYNLTNANYRQLLTGIDVATTGGVLMRTTVGSAVAVVDTRSFNLSGGNQIVWTDCYDSKMKTGNTPVAFEIDNTSCIPFAIYGVKK